MVPKDGSCKTRTGLLILFVPTPACCHTRRNLVGTTLGTPPVVGRPCHTEKAHLSALSGNPAGAMRQESKPFVACLMLVFITRRMCSRSIGSKLAHHICDFAVLLHHARSGAPSFGSKLLISIALAKVSDSSSSSQQKVTHSKVSSYMSRWTCS